jgi:hypothetical protein
MLAGLLLRRSIFLLAVGTSFGCNRDYTIQLPNDYFVARVSPGVFAVVDPQNRVVTEQSHRGIALAVAGDIVLGEIDPASKPSADLRTHGFFVINTRTNESWLKLSRAEFLERLRNERVNAPRRLVPVDRTVTLGSLRSAV